MLVPPLGLPGMLDLREVDYVFDSTGFLEEDGVSQDAIVVDHTWKKANKDGSRDKRFTDNYQIPIAKYGELHFRSQTGVDEAFMFSDFSKAQQFADALSAYVGSFDVK